MATGSGHITRRLALQLAAGTVAFPGVSAGAESVDYSRPRALLAAYRRLRYSAGSGLVFWWTRGTKYGLVDHQLTPLFGMEIGSFAQARSTGPDSFAATSLEIVFFTDPVTGKRVDHITNPYSGERIARPDSLVGPATIEYTLEGPRYPASLPGVRFEIKPSITLFAAEGEDIWVRDDNTTNVMAAEGGAPQFVVSDMATFHCSRAALAEPALESVPSTWSFSAVSSWIRWMNMGERAGEMVSRGNGRKFFRLEGMPGSFLDILRSRYPDVAKDPAAALARAPFSFAP